MTIEQSRLDDLDAPGGRRPIGRRDDASSGLLAGPCEALGRPRREPTAVAGSAVRGPRSTCPGWRSSGAARPTRWPPTGATCGLRAALALRAGHRPDGAGAERRRGALAAAPSARARSAASVARRRCRSCAGCHRFLVDEGLADRPTRPSTSTGARVPRRLPKALTEAEVERAARRRGRRRRRRRAATGPCSSSSTAPGARISEVVGLDLADLAAGRRPGPPLRQGLQGAARPPRPLRRRAARRVAGSRGAGPLRARGSGAGGATPRRCSSTPEAGG